MDIKTIHHTTELKSSGSISETSASSKDREPTQGGMYFQQDFKQKTDDYSGYKQLKEESTNNDSQAINEEPVDIKKLLDSINHQREFNALVRSEFARKVEDML